MRPLLVIAATVAVSWSVSPALAHSGEEHGGQPDAVTPAAPAPRRAAPAPVAPSPYARERLGRVPGADLGVMDGSRIEATRLGATVEGSAPMLDGARTAVFSAALLPGLTVQLGGYAHRRDPIDDHTGRSAA